MASGQLPTSLTAPIDEFRVLWTSQKKQKLKKWQDGFLRFHTYNKRMIVYDETRTLVCDMYLQRAEKVNEGDELEFEHHLVTVEEFKGRVVQDLTAIISPIIERRQQRQMQPTHTQNPLYPERNVRVEALTFDSPLSRQTQPKTPLQAPSMGGIGETAHVSLNDILRRSHRKQHAVYNTAMRTPARGPILNGPSRMSIGLPTPGSASKGDETPTRSSTISEKKIFQPSTGTSCNASGSRNHIMPSFGGRLAMEGSETPKIYPGSAYPFKTPQDDSGDHIPSAVNSVSRTHNRLTFESSAPPLINHATPSGFERSAYLQIPVDGGGAFVPPEKVSILSKTRRPYKRPAFTADRAVTPRSRGGSPDIHMSDVSPVSLRGSSPLDSKRRKKDSESRPTTTIKLATAKRRMLISRQQVSRERSPEILTKEGISEQKLSDDFDAIGQNTIFLGKMISDGLKHNIKSKITAVSVTSTHGAQEHRLHEDEDDTDTRKEASENRASVEHRSFELSVLASARDSNSLSRSISAGEKKGRKQENNEKEKKGEMRENGGADNSKTLSEGCVDLAASPGKAAESCDLTLSSSSTKRRERKKKSQPRAQECQITKEKEAAGFGKTSNVSEFGPWSIEAFDLFDWRPPGFVN